MTPLTNGMRSAVMTGVSRGLMLGHVTKFRRPRDRRAGPVARSKEKRLLVPNQKEIELEVDFSAYKQNRNTSAAISETDGGLNVNIRISESPWQLAPPVSCIDVFWAPTRPLLSIFLP